MGRLAVFLSSGLYIGYLPKAPGTFGTLWGILLFYLLRGTSSTVFFIFVTLFIIFAVIVSQLAERHLGTHDQGLIVIDEIAGYLVTVLGFSFSWQTAVLGFFLFRLFDIWKPIPIRWLDEKIPGGLGVVLDDVFAGIYGWLCLHIIFYFFPQWIGG